MKLTLGFKELQELSGFANTILSDKSVEDKLKNFIFMCTKDKVQISGYNAFTFSRSAFENYTLELDEGVDEWDFQIKASELNKILASYSSLYKTVVDWVDIEVYEVRLRLTVHEVPKEGESEQYKKDSVFYLESLPILGNIKQELKKEFPEQLEYINGDDIIAYLDTLTGLMSNDQAGGVNAKLNFAEDYVFVISATDAVFLKNHLVDAFKDICLSYSSAVFLNKVVESGCEISVSRFEDKYLCIAFGTSEAFLKYQRIKVKHQHYVERKSKDRGIVLNRLYLKDVLKRMTDASVNARITVESETELMVENGNFSQVVPIDSCRDAVGVSFSISNRILNKLIVGRDDLFDESLFIYFVENPKGYLIYLSDKSGAWFSTTQVVK